MRRKDLEYIPLTVFADAPKCKIRRNNMTIDGLVQGYIPALDVFHVQTWLPVLGIDQLVQAFFPREWVEITDVERFEALVRSRIEGQQTALEKDRTFVDSALMRLKSALGKKDQSNG